MVPRIANIDLRPAIAVLPRSTRERRATLVAALCSARPRTGLQLRPVSLLPHRAPHRSRASPPESARALLSLLPVRRRLFHSRCRATARLRPRAHPPHLAVRLLRGVQGLPHTPHPLMQVVLP